MLVDIAKNKLREGDRQTAQQVVEAVGVKWTAGTIEEMIARHVMQWHGEAMPGANLLANTEKAAKDGFVVTDEWTLQQLSRKRRSVVAFDVFPGFAIAAGAAFRLRDKHLGEALQTALKEWLFRGRKIFDEKGVGGMMAAPVIVQDITYNLLQEARKRWNDIDPEGCWPRSPEQIFPSAGLIPLYLGEDMKELDEGAIEELCEDLRVTFRTCVVNWYFDAERDADGAVVLARGKKIEAGFLRELFESVLPDYSNFTAIHAALYAELKEFSRSAPQLGSSGLKIELRKGDILIVKGG